jgi:hypothetical protein
MGQLAQRHPPGAELERQPVTKLNFVRFFDHRCAFPGARVWHGPCRQSPTYSNQPRPRPLAAGPPVREAMVAAM